MTDKIRAFFILLLLIPVHVAHAEDIAIDSDEILAAETASTPVEINETISLIERFFEGGNFDQTISLCDTLLQNKYFQPLPPPQQPVYKIKPTQEQVAADEEVYRFILAGRLARQALREKVRFLRARAGYEKAIINNNNKLLRLALEEMIRLADNKYGFDDQHLKAETYFYVGSGFMVLHDFANAIKYFRKVGESSPTPALDIKTSLRLADALSEQADIIGTNATDQPGRSPQDLPDNPQAVLKSRQALIREAETELSKITTNHSRSEHHGDVELRLIKFRYQLQAYGDAYRLADEFMGRSSPGSVEYSDAAYYRAFSKYYLGQITEAVQLFKDALSENQSQNSTPQIREKRADLFFGYGWTNAQLARTSGPEYRLVYLTRAQTALKASLDLLEYGAKRQEVTIELARVLIDLKEYHEALSFLSEVLRIPSMQIHANYLAGVAAMGAEQYEEAATYMHTVLELSEAFGNSKYDLLVLKSLADIERSEKAHAEALAYYRMARDKAIQQRQFDIVASASLGIAISQAELAYFDPKKRDAAARRVADSILALTVAAKISEPANLNTAATVLSFRTGALYELTNASSANLDKALTTLRELRGRLLPRLRKDELEFVEGKIYFLKAQDSERQRDFNFRTTKYDFFPVFEDYIRAEDIINNALVANPRGDFSPQTRYLLGQVLSAYAELKLKIARMLHSRGLGTEAPDLESDAEKAYRKAVQPLNMAVIDSENNPELRVNARTLLGKTYLAIGRLSKEISQFEKGLDEFKLLANEPSITPEEKIKAKLSMAKALAENGRKTEAYALLLPLAKNDVTASITAMKLVEEKQPAKAYAIGLHAITLAENAKKKDRQLASEVIYLSYTLALSRVDDIADTLGLSTKELSDKAFSGLVKLATDYSETEWASRGMLALGQSLLKAGRWEDALLRADQGIKRLSDNITAIETVQALYILKGRALMQGGKTAKERSFYQDALRAFKSAERANTRTPLGRMQRAMAVREQGNAYLALGQEEDALRLYGRVFSFFHHQYEQADLARIAAAYIHVDRKSYEQALNVLEGCFDADLKVDHKIEIQKLIDQEEE